MNFSVKKKSIVEFLNLASSIVEKRNTMPILANVKISVEDKTLTMMATNLDISVYSEIEANVVIPGEITANAKNLAEIVNELPGEVINFSISKGQRIDIESGNSTFKINGLSAIEYPKIQGVDLKNPVSVEARKISEMLEKVSFAVSQEETRYNINGVYVETIEQKIVKDKKGIRFVATDGHRLAVIDRPAEGLAFSKNVILPRKGTSEIRKLVENNTGVAYVSVNNSFFIIRSGGITLGLRLIDGEYPNYSKVIPSEISTEFTTNKSELLAAVKRVSLVTTDQCRALCFDLNNNNLRIYSSSPEFGEADEQLTVKQSGKDVRIGFSARYITELLTAMSGSEMVTVKLNGENGPGLFLSDNDEYYKCVVMPMRFDF
ncbi:MAG: DNA polymerase III subunit beta [Deltaproteobacteria bacterium]|nr:DNA polymerase III subunit beta [Deltaproteobacteria bacterium]